MVLLLFGTSTCTAVLFVKHHNHERFCVVTNIAWIRNITGCNQASRYSGIKTEVYTKQYRYSTEPIFENIMNFRRLDFDAYSFIGFLKTFGSNTIRNLCVVSFMKTLLDTMFVQGFFLLRT